MEHKAILFIDFEKAFDSIDRDILWEILKHYEISEKLVKMIMALYERSECCIRTESGETRFFRIVFSVKQGCVLSLFLFVIITDYVLRQSSGSGVKISSRQISDFDFADDIVLQEEVKQRLQMLLDTITDKSKKVGLTVKVDKSTSNSPLMLRCKDKDIQQVQEFKYLGSLIENDGQITNEIKRRIG